MALGLVGAGAGAGARVPLGGGASPARQAPRLMLCMCCGMAALRTHTHALPILLSNPGLQEAREALFGGAGYVPDIPALQAWLGEARKAG